MQTKIFVVFLAFTCVLRNQIVGAKTIYVWRDSYQKCETTGFKNQLSNQILADKAEVDNQICTNLPPNLAGEVTSVDTRNTCARLYAGWNCSGDAIELLPHSPSHTDLATWKFNDRTVSIGPCLDPCDPQITGGAPNEPFNVTIFDRKDYKGAYLDITLEECTPIPTRFVHHFFSIATNGHCVQLWKNLKCESSTPSGTYDYETIELRNGTPNHNNIRAVTVGWWFAEVRAASHCSFKCNNSTKLSNTSNFSRQPDVGEVILYDNINFSGNWTVKKLEDECVNLHGVWEGVTGSVKAFSGACVKLYDRRNCVGAKFSFTDDVPNLVQRNFEGVARSLSYCNSSVSAYFVTKSQLGVTGGLILSPVVISVIVVCVVLILAISVGTILTLLRRLRRARKLSEREIREFLKGFALENGNRDSGFGGGGSEVGSNVSVHSTCFEDVEVVALHREYNMRYEVEKRKFTLDNPIGMGEFGIVYKGILTGANNIKMNVAVKTLKSDSGIQHLRSLMKEVKVMLFINELGEHPNVVRVVGCCTELLRNGDLFLLLEYCSHGSLKSYLCKNNQNFRNIVVNGKIAGEQAIRNKRFSILNSQKCGGENPVYFDFFQQLLWMIEIASGMEFLSSSKIVHRDLAARNVLLDDQFHSKISDFGLSRKTYNYSSYQQKGEDPVPWKWLPLESLLHGSYSTKSDAWSYGIVCWEIFSLGEEPFRGEVWGDGYIEKLSNGYRLPKPIQCIDDCYQLMLNCWNKNVSYRPDFVEILRVLKHTQNVMLKLVSEKSRKAFPEGYVNTFIVDV